MKTADAQAFHALLTGVMGFYGKGQPSDIEAEIWWESTRDFDLADVRAAMTAHVKNPDRGRFAPKPADVIAAISDNFAAQWPGPDEAWALALKAADERETVVWTDEAARAFAIASPILAEGDKVGARMAFKQAYERAVQAAVMERRAPRPLVSLGWDAEARVNALESAVSSGLLGREQAEPYLLSARREISEEGRAVAGLLTGKVVQHPSAPEAVKRRIEELMQAIRAAPDFDAGKAMAKKEARDREARAKAEARRIAEGAA